MADTIRGLVARYMSGESTYPETLESLHALLGSRRAQEVLHRAVESDSEDYLLLVA